MINYFLHEVKDIQQTVLGTMVTASIKSNYSVDFIKLIDNLIEEASERNMYGNSVLEYTFSHKDERDYKKIIKCHPETINFFIMFDGYEPRSTMLITKDGHPVEISYDRKVKKNLLRFIDGLYTNEIIIIELPEIK